MKQLLEMVTPMKIIMRIMVTFVKNLVIVVIMLVPVVVIRIVEAGVEENQEKMNVMQVVILNLVLDNVEVPPEHSVLAMLAVAETLVHVLAIVVHVMQIAVVITDLRRLMKPLTLGIILSQQMLLNKINRMTLGEIGIMKNILAHWPIPKSSHQAQYKTKRCRILINYRHRLV